MQSPLRFSKFLRLTVWDGSVLPEPVLNFLDCYNITDSSPKNSAFSYSKKRHAHLGAFCRKSGFGSSFSIYQISVCENHKKATHVFLLLQTGKVAVDV